MTKRFQRLAKLRRFSAVVLTTALLAGCSPATVPHAPEPALADLVEDLLPHVVNISYFNVKKGPDGVLKRVGKGLGSGYVVDPSGIIVTNRHVTDGGNEFYVTFSTNLQLKATLIYRSPDIDMALLQVFPPRPLSAVKWGDSDRLRRGDPVIAIGNPLGLAGTVTTGIVSATDRNIRETEFDSFIQIDAAINPGNSGGPLFNAKGEAVGMNTALFAVPGADASGSIGLNFSIPGNDVQFVLNSLSAHGRVQRGYLGADMQDVTGSLGNALGIDPPDGAIVAGIVAGSPANRAGLQIGDIVQKLGNFPIHNLRNATRAITASDTGAVQTVEFLRNGKRQAVQVRLVDASTDTAKVAMKMEPMRAHAITAEELGIDGQAVTMDLRRKLSLDSDAPGVVLTSVNASGLGASLGFKVGDLILRVQDVSVHRVQDVIDAAVIARAEKRNFLAMLVVDNEGTHWVTVPLTN
jgi:serine protease Do